MLPDRVHDDFRRLPDEISAYSSSALCAVLCGCFFDGGWALFRLRDQLDAYEGFLLMPEEISELVLENLLFASSLLIWSFVPVVLAQSLSARIAARVPRRSRELTRALAIAGFALPAWALFLRAMASGPKAKALFGAPLRLSLLAIVFSLALGALPCFFAHVSSRLPLRRGARELLLSISAIGFVAADRLVLPGLYPALHALFALCALLSVQLAFHPHLQVRARLLPPLVTAVLLVSAPFVRPFAGDPLGSFYLAQRTVFSANALTVAGALREASHLYTGGEGKARHATTFRTGLFDLSARKTRDVIVLSVDGLSPFRATLEADEPGRIATPFLAGFARAGTSFRRHYVTYPQTDSSLRALLSGHLVAPAIPTRGLRMELVTHYRRAGYTTFCAFPFLATIQRDFGDSEGCDVSVTSWDDGNVERRLLEFLRDTNGHPVFVLVHFVGTHEPFQYAPESLVGAGFEAEYEAALRTADARLERISRALADRSRPRCAVVTSDHGHAFGWHRQVGHNSSLYEDQIRAPLLFQGCGFPSGNIDVATSTIDLTRLLTGEARAQALYEGLVRGGANSPRTPTPVLTVWEHSEALILEDHKLIRDRRTGSLELYDVAHDPKESANLLAREPERARELTRLLDESSPFRGEKLAHR